MGRRNITKNILEEDIEINDDHVVAQVGDPLGKNLHQLQYYVNDELVDTIGQLPPKFRNLVWIKRGQYSEYINIL
jgi:probable RNA-binding protein EIF1AD